MGAPLAWYTFSASFLGYLAQICAFLYDNFNTKMWEHFETSGYVYTDYSHWAPWSTTNIPREKCHTSKSILQSLGKSVIPPNPYSNPKGNKPYLQIHTPIPRDMSHTSKSILIPREKFHTSKPYLPSWWVIWWYKKNSNNICHVYYSIWFDWTHQEGRYDFEV